MSSSIPQGPGNRILAPLDRSVQLALAWRPNRDVWGATWAFACGLCAALPWVVSPLRLATFVSVWFVAVPLWGRVWVALLDEPDRAEPRTVRDDGQPPAVDGLRQRLGLLRPSRPDGLAGSLIIALALAASLDPRLLAPLLLGLGACLIEPLLVGRRSTAHGAARSLCELWCPAVTAWLIAGGGRGLPADLRVGLGNLSDLWAWWSQHWAVPSLFLAFSLVFWASIVDGDASIGRHARVLLVSAYLIAISILALVGNPLLAALVAGIFILQWPYQVGLGAGRRVWHFRATQGLAMLAMLLAAFSVAA